MTNTWAREAYRQNAAYVPALGAAAFELLNPQAGERILDLGCGEGTLTEKIAGTGAEVNFCGSCAWLACATMVASIFLPCFSA